MLHRRKLGFPVPIRHWLRDEMYDWARGIVRDSQADHLIDLGRRAADARRAPRPGRCDHSRRIWTLLVFLLWHGIFVERADPAGGAGAGVPGDALYPLRAIA